MHIRCGGVGELIKPMKALGIREDPYPVRISTRGLTRAAGDSLPTQREGLTRPARVAGSRAEVPPGAASSNAVTHPKQRV